MASQPATAAAVPANTRPTAEVADGGVRITTLGVTDRVFWDALVLFGAGRLEEVRSLARAQRERGPSGLLLSMAMARLDNDPESFEDHAVQYAVETGQSPPVWIASKAAAAEAKLAKSGETVRVKALTIDHVLEASIKMESPFPLVIDLAEVSKVEAAGMELFHEALRGRIERSEKTRIINADRTVSNLVEKLRAPGVVGQPAVWYCVFSLLILLNRKEDFDRLNADYTQKFDKSFEWIELEQDSEDERTPLISTGIEVGEKLGALNQQFARNLLKTDQKVIEARAANGTVDLDFLSTVRWTMADMPGVLDFARILLGERLKLRFINVNELLAALLRAYALDRAVPIFSPGAIT